MTRADEIRLIAEAVAAGKVRVIPIGVSSEDEPVKRNVPHWMCRTNSRQRGGRRGGETSGQIFRERRRDE